MRGSARRAGHVPAVRHAERRAADPGVHDEPVGRPARGLGRRSRARRSRSPASRRRRPRRRRSTFAGKDTGTIKIANGRAETVVFQAKATLPVGGAKLRVVATAQGRRPARSSVTDEVDVPFLPAGPKERVDPEDQASTAGKLDLAAQAGAQELGADERDHDVLADVEPVRRVVRAPELPHPLPVRLHRADDVVDAAAALRRQASSSRSIRELAQLQDRGHGARRASTACSRWRRRRAASATGRARPSRSSGRTAYATHMLLDAKKRRLRGARRSAAGGARRGSRTASLRTSAASRIHASSWNHYDEQAEAYLHYVLALAGKGKKARILQADRADARRTRRASRPRTSTC